MKQYLYCLLSLSIFSIILSFGEGETIAQPDNELPPMGMNVYTPSYYDNVIYFTDATRHASDWISFNLIDDSIWNDERPIPQTENGYPASLEQDQGARTLIFLGTTIVPAGDYTLTWTGTGTLRIVVNNANHAEFTSSGEQAEIITLSEAGDTSLWLEIIVTDSNDPLRDIHLWLPDYDENTNSIFTPWFLNEIANFNPIRPMQWTVANESTIIEWEDRAQMSWYTWAAWEGMFSQGVPFEIQIALANEINSDLWITVPHMVTDDFILQLALLIHEQLNPELRVWVEYTNEHWNPIFSQATWLNERAIEIRETEGLSDYYLYHHYGRRTGEVLSIFEDIFIDNPDRVIGVLGGLSAWGYPAESALLEINQQGNIDLVDVLAIAPYWGNYAEDGTWNVDALITSMDINNLTEANYELIFAELYRAVDAIFSGDNEYAQEMRANRDLAQAYNLRLVAYEAGQHLTAYDLENSGFAGTVDSVLGVYNQVNARPEMYDLYRYYLDQWRAFGGETIVMYHLAGSSNEVETFGHMDTILQPLEDAHKYRALLDWLALLGE